MPAANKPFKSSKKINTRERFPPSSSGRALGMSSQPVRIRRARQPSSIMVWASIPASRVFP
ncbi:MAG: hypothetical protein L6Q49_21915 [Anaerolineales bacterium]|nr:hypothetical protein [Anaerolineales bacterium]